MDTKKGMKVNTQLRPTGSSKKIIHSQDSDTDKLEEKLDKYDHYSTKVFNDLMSLYQEERQYGS